ncbi:iron complex outermembrane recepter protein [Mucilaginibacter sp. OK268]|uniref:TonB-dependent receptor n=1 Tax=Mucilaginibacter sp. OK268 TaxID=1881048 RepID=UPI000888D30D|nr:TonB-dependent receptor [Mucilaginibacter sp. OK268]SDP74416.1 iron complex outermembrane recepter protein [Mucilaginibacter sp. OK268]
MKILYIKTSLLLVFMASANILFGQGIKGKITDAANGATMPGVSVSVVGTSQGASSNEKGEYSLKLSQGSYQLKVSFIGYETQTTSVTVSGSTQTLDFSLKPLSNALNEVAVVGSRSTKPRTNIESPVPVDVISAKEMRSFPQTDITQVLNYIAPSFSSNRQTVADGTDHIDPASLRGLGPDQVLVLVNGKRRHTTALVNINGTFGRGTVGTDMNSIPLAAIDHIEVLRDGAAAQYGSDAIAGVINIVLKKVTPLVISTSYGQSATSTNGNTYTDGKTYQIDGSKGWDLNGKGFVNVAAQYLDRGATNRGGLDTHPLIYSALPTKGANESEADFETRFAGIKAADDAKAKADGFKRDNMMIGNSHSKNFGSFGNAQYSVADWATVYLATGYTHKTGSAAGFIRLPNQFTQIDATIYPDGFLPFINTSINDISASGGVKGKISDWTYDLSNTFGENNLSYTIDHTLNASLPIGTSPTSFKAGELIFKQNTVNLDVSRKYDFTGFLTSLNMAYGAEYRIDNYEIKPGEELSYSYGQPSKNIPGRVVGATPAAAGSQVFPGFKPSNAIDKSRNNQSLYADYEAEFGPRVLLEAAGRYEHFSDFGSNFSYKFTGKVKVIDQLAIRGAIATGFRAPSLAQRYFNNESTQFVSGNPTQVLTVNNDNPIVRKFGVGSLKPEKSKSYSLGLAGKITSALTFTIDAYQIDIKDRIVFSSQFTRAIPAVADILNTVDPNGQINSVQFFTNAISTRTKGLDIVLADRISINAASSLTLSAAANFNQTKVRSIQGSDIIEGSAALKAKLFDRTERSRFESSVPASKINLSALYNIRKFDFSLRSVYFGKVTYLNSVDPTIPANNLPLELDQTYSGKWVTDLAISYKVIKQLGVTLSASNLFDVYPDKNYMDPRNNVNNLSGNPANNYTTNRDNTSNGHFVYSRAVSQFGFNGRFLSGKVVYTF